MKIPLRQTFKKSYSTLVQVIKTQEKKCTIRDIHTPHQSITQPEQAESQTNSQNLVLKEGLSKRQGKNVNDNSQLHTTRETSMIEIL